jgi:hypothetical protein
MHLTAGKKGSQSRGERVWVLDIETHLVKAGESVSLQQTKILALANGRSDE